VRMRSRTGDGDTVAMPSMMWAGASTAIRESNEAGALDDVAGVGVEGRGSTVRLGGSIASTTAGGANVLTRRELADAVVRSLVTSP